MAQAAGLQEGGAAGARGPHPMLAGFVRYLEDAGLVEFRVEGDGDEAVDNRIRMDALVLLANRLGLGSPYRCDTYIYGPRSDALFDDCLALSRNRESMYDGVPASVPDSFRREAFEGLVRGRDMSWLIAASSMADMWSHNMTREDMIYTISDDDLKGHKPTYPRERVSGILDELERAGVVTAYT